MASDHRHELPTERSASQLNRVETLLASVRDIVSSLSRMSAQLEREVTHALHVQPPRSAPAGPPPPSEIDALELENSQLKQALEGRPVIEQAKGMLMSRHGCDADEAFQLLVLASRRDQRKVREVAVDVVASTRRHRGTSNDLGVSIVRHPAGTARPTPGPSGGTPTDRVHAVPVPGRATPANVSPPRRVTLPPDAPVDVPQR
jgi:hypothetical protein